jgi:hypothetical protein
MLSVALMTMGSFTSSCLGHQTGASSGDVLTCIEKYHPATPDPMPSGHSAQFFRDVVYAEPCQALAAAGEQRWSVIVVGQDGRTLRVYFVAGLVDERCDLLRTVRVTESSTGVNIALEAGADPAIRPGTGSPPAACSAVGQAYVTQATLRQPLGTRTITGPSNDGVIVRL